MLLLLQHASVVVRKHPQSKSIRLLVHVDVLGLDGYVLVIPRKYAFAMLLKSFD